MAQDFAKQRPPQEPAPRKNSKPAPRTGSKGSSWNWFFSGLLAGILLTAGSYIGLLRYQALNPTALDTTGAAQAAAPLPDFDFGFYQELATAEVAVNPPATANSTVTAGSTDNPAPALPAPPTINYLLQAGSFQDRGEADERRAKITLMNMSADIVPGVVAGRTWYRVQVGPFAGRDNAEAARRDLSASNIDSIPLLMR